MLAMHGANYYSGGPVIIMKLDLGEYDEVFTNEIPGFYEKLKAMVPSLYQHYCSPGIRRRFFPAGQGRAPCWAM
jgi:cyanophycin synthetase